jgi:hypothetical protein
VRSKLAQWAVRTSGLKYTAWRSISALSKGEIPGPENSIGKLVAGTTLQEIAMFALDLQGQSGVLMDPAQVDRGGALPGDAAALAGHPHRGRHRRDPAQHHRRAGAGAAGGHAGRSGHAVQPDPDASNRAGRRRRDTLHGRATPVRAVTRRPRQGAIAVCGRLCSKHPSETNHC